MDRWPSEREEPKAPDKNVDSHNSKDNSLMMKLKSETNFSNCGKGDDYSHRSLAQNKESSVSSLNEPDLKALLEEAMTYKRPKDIQGKSDLFKELLQSVESEKKYSILSRPEKQSNRKPRRKQMNKKEIEKTTHEGPFQDLIVHMSDCDSSNKRQLKYSLKSNVAQLVPVDAASVCNENNPEVTALLENGTIDSIEELKEIITAEANIYQVKEVVPDSRAVAHPLSSNTFLEENEEEAETRISVKDTVSFTSPVKESGDLSVVGRESLAEIKKSLDENGNSVSNSRIESLAERKAKARRLKAKNDRNIILSHHIEGHRSDIAQDIDAIMEYIESPKISDSKNTRQRSSMSLSKHSSRSNNKISRARDKSSEAFSRKSPKTKGNKLQKSSSLEEVSISKFEDLTQGDKDEDLPKSTTKIKCDRGIPKTNLTKGRSETITSALGMVSMIDKIESETVDTDFLPVTKKNRKKKGVSENSFRNGRRNVSGSYRSEKMLSSYVVKSQKLEGFSSSREFKRRKSISSIPSSDKSGDSSDLDSVHSFPVSHCKGKGSKPSVSLYTGSTPQISYADIARSVPSPSRLTTDLSPSTDNIGEFDYDSVCSPREAIPTVILQLPAKKERGKGSVDLHQDYPPLDTKFTDKNFSSSDMFVEYTVLVPKRNSCTFQSNCVNVEETVLIEMPSSDISEMEGINIALDNHLPSKRPPVILMNSNSNDSNEVNDLVFGFEVNEQLLNCSNSESHINSEISLDENSEKVIVENVGTEPIASMESPSKSHLQQSFTSEHSQNHLDIVQYISSEWEFTLAALENEESSSKIVYYTP